MATEISPAEKARLVAVEAAAAAQRAADGADADFITSVRNRKELSAGCTASEANRRASKYISLMGYEAWVSLLQRP